MPDNSGTVCPVCGSEGPNDYVLDCQDCGRPPGNIPEDEAGRKRYYKAKEKLQREHYGAKMWDFAEAVGDHGPSVCLDCLYSIRERDGSARSVCSLCLATRYDGSAFQYCETCRSFVGLNDFRDGSCRWCRELGAWESLALLTGRLDEMRRAVSPGPAAEDRRRKFLEENFPDWVRSLEDRQKRVRSGIIHNNKYEALVSALDTPEWRPSFAGYLKEYDGKTGHALEKYGLEGLFRAMDIKYWHYYSMDTALQYIARAERERFSRDPDLRELLDEAREGDPRKKMEYSLKNGTNIPDLMAAVEKMLELSIQRVLGDNASAGFPDILAEVRARYPQLPRPLLWVYLASHGPPYGQLDALKRAGIDSPAAILSGLEKEPDLAVVLHAWGFYQSGDGEVRWPESWSLIANQAVAGIFGISRPEALELARFYCEGTSGPERPSPKLASLLEKVPAVPVEDARALSAFLEEERSWGRLARLLAGRKLPCQPPGEALPFLLEATHHQPKLRKDFDPYIDSLIRTQGEERLERIRDSWTLRSFLERTGQRRLLFEEMRRHHQHDNTWVWLFSNGYAGLCFQFGEKEALREYLVELRDNEDDTIEHRLDPTENIGFDPWDEWCLTLEATASFLRGAVLDGMLGDESAMRDRVGGAVSFLKKRIPACLKAGIPPERHHLLLEDLKALAAGPESGPMAIAEFMRAVDGRYGTAAEEGQERRTSLRREAYRMDLDAGKIELLRKIVMELRK